MSFRTLCACIMFASLCAWWWVGAIVALTLSLRFRAWEAILFGVLLDVLWLPSGAFYGIPLATCSAIALVWLFEPLRRQFLFDYD